jgi:hypothetical protein
LIKQIAKPKMKPIEKQLPLRNVYENLAIMIFMTVLFIISLFQEASAQTTNRFDNDPFFPARHRFNVGLYTSYRGPSIAAPVAIGEVTYGFTKRFSMGFIVGTTGTLAVVGIRLAGSVYQKENFSLKYRMSVIYYPERNGTFLFDRTSQQVMPWFLSTGLLDGEWRMKSGLRWSVGMGLLETHCADGMMNLILGRKPSAEEEKNELPFHLFNTFQGAVSIPLSSRFTLRPEAIFVCHGLHLIGADDPKVSPVILYLNLVYAF